MNIFELSKTRIVTVAAALALCAVALPAAPAAANENSPAEAYLSQMIAATAAPQNEMQNPVQSPPQGPAQNQAGTPAQGETVLWPGDPAHPVSNAETLNGLSPQAAAEAAVAAGADPAAMTDAEARRKAAYKAAAARKAATARPTTLARNNVHTRHNIMRGGNNGWVTFNQ